jgi:hypothetical protein
MERIARREPQKNKQHSIRVLLIFLCAKRLAQMNEELKMKNEEFYYILAVYLILNLYI